MVNNQPQQLKILVVIALTLNEADGQGAYSISLIRQLSKTYRLLVITGGKLPDVIPEQVEIFNILPEIDNFLRLKNIFYSIYLSWRIFTLIGRRNIFLVLSLMDYPYSIVAYIIAKFLNRPLVLSAVGTYSLLPFNNWIDGRLHGLILKKAKKVVCISHFTETMLRQKIALDNTVVVNPGVDVKKFETTEKNISQLSGESIKIVSIGAIKKRKGLHITIPAVAAVARQYPLKYYIIGNDSNKKYINELKTIVTDSRLGSVVEFLGSLPEREMIDYLQSADLFLLTPINTRDNVEGFGLVYLEAGACGKPVIGSRNCGAEDAIIDGETGILVPQNDIVATTEAILRIVGDHDLAYKLGQNGLNRAKQMTWLNQSRQYVNIFENI